MAQFRDILGHHASNRHSLLFPFALSLSKGSVAFQEEEGFDKLSPNGEGNSDKSYAAPACTGGLTGLLYRAFYREV